MNYNKSKKHKRLNKNKKTRNRLNGGNGCGCKSLFNGGSNNYVHFNNNISTKDDPLINLVSSRTLPNVPYKTVGGKYNKTNKKRKSKKLKGGNGYLTQFNNQIDYNINTTRLNSLLGYQSLTPQYNLV